ncbi:RHS repeat-associated core domain-containing protein [Photobacterium sanguinicancri]|uniref:RHS repeat-associated core domain-containing protein n=1 Tax=Photobacterium sanguinicancri TaxID=875932 RepID=UPI0021C3AD92|nr:RHS repeat-associated core domain-containing protein [Photobacterium sanguinicancri]
MSLVIGIKLKASDGMVYHFVTTPQQAGNLDAVTFNHPSAAHILIKMFEHLYEGVHGRDLLSVAELVEPTLARRARLEPSAYKTEILQVLNQALMKQRLSCLRMPETKPVIAHEEQPSIPPVQSQASLPKAGGSTQQKETVGDDAIRMDTPAVSLSETEFCGDPVSMVTGEEVLSLTDVTLAGGHSLEWGRIYRSGQCNIDIGMGFGWRSKFQYELSLVDTSEKKELPKQWCFTDNEGSTLFFDDVDIGAVSYQIRAGASLYHHPEKYHLLRLKDGRQIRFNWLHGAWRMDKLRINQTVQYGFQYSVAGRMTGIDINGYLVLALRYDRSGHLISVEVPQVSKNDPIIVLASYQYDENGHQISATNRNQQTEHYQYRDDHLITCRTRASGFRHYFEWLGDGKSAKCCSQYGDKGNYHYQFDYDDQAKVSISTDSRGHQWHYRHNEQGLLLEKVSPKGARWQYYYNQLGLKVTEIAPNNGVTHYRYNNQGLLAELEMPSGELTAFRYNRFGQCIEQVNTQGLVTSHRFNSLGLLLSTTHPDGRNDEYLYDHQGRLTKQLAANGDQLQYWWNERGLLDAVKVNNALTRYSYDSTSEINGVAYPDGKVAAFQRDSSGNITKSSQYHPGSDEPVITHSFEYDQAGRIVSHTDPIGRKLRVIWGGLSQPEALIQADGSHIAYQYDEERNLVGISRSDGCCYQLEWDEEERLSRTVGFDGREQHYRYDENGELIALQEADRNVRIQRDIAGRVTTMFAVSASGTRDSIQFHYDDANRLINANTATRKLRQEWLLHSHPVATWQDHHQFQYGFNRQGLRQQLVLADSQNITYQYDANQQLSQILLNGEMILDISHDNQGRECQRQQGNGFNLNTHYDEQGRLSHQQWNTPLSDKKSSHDRHYFYDQASQLTRIHDRHLGEQAYSFDALNQLQSHRIGLDIHRYKFDSFGNPVSESSVVEQDQLLAHKDIAFNYDLYGNQILSRSQSATQHRQFNGLNQLVQVNHQGRTSFYEYDAQGRRSRKVTEQEMVDFLWDGDQLIGEYQQGQYRWYIYAPNDFTPLALIDNGEVYYFHTDHQGTPLAITDSCGETVWQANYRTFGFADITIEKVKNPLRYQGQYFDDESGLHYNRFRYYDPITGRFIHQDPIGLLGGINHYRYAPNPVQWVDPLGLSCKEGGGNALLNSAYFLGGITKYSGNAVTGTIEAIYADPTGVAWDTLYTVVDAVYYPIDIVTRPLGFTTHAVDRTNARINDALGAAQELKVNTVANWECRNWEGLGSNLAAIGMVVNPRSLVKGSVTKVVGISNLPIFKQYIREVEKFSKVKLGRDQKALIKEFLRNKDNGIKKLSTQDAKAHRWTNSTKDQLIKEWEMNTGQKWPRYEEDKLSKRGRVYIRKGEYFDAHEIIPNQYNAPHSWWNIVPAERPNAHQGGIHGAGSGYSKIVDRF